MREVLTSAADNQGTQATGGTSLRARSLLAGLALAPLAPVRSHAAGASGSAPAC